MSNGHFARVALALPLLCLGAIGMAAPSASPAHSSLRACEAWVTDTVAVGQKAVPVNAKLGQDIGDSVTASFPAESNLAVSEAKLGSAPKTVDLTINAASALPGDWKLTLKGTAGTCAGNVTVAAKAKNQAGQ